MSPARRRSQGLRAKRKRKAGICKDCSRKAAPFSRCKKCRARAAKHKVEVRADRPQEQKTPRPRQLTFRFKKQRDVQWVGTTLVLMRTRNEQGRPDDDVHRQRWQARHTRRLDRAYKRLGIKPITVATPEWIEEDKRDEIDMLNWMALGRRLR